MCNEQKFDFICNRAFKEVELKENGDITPCCPIFTNFYTFGNIFNDDIENIMNSERAKEFRRSIINKEYTYCNTDKCIGANAIADKELAEYVIDDGTALKYSEVFSFGHDRCCNLLCVFCRDHNWMNSEEEVSRLNSMIDSHFIPLLRDTKIVKMLASGEVFASRHGRLLVKTITRTLPKIKFNIVSNGVLFDKKNCEDLGLIGKLNQVTISVHSASKKVYDKLIRNGNYEKVWANIEWLNSLKASGNLELLDLVFTITHLNYQEMAIFAKRAVSLGIEFKFFEYRKEEGKFSEQYEEAAVWLKTNKRHKKFLKVISDPVFDSPLCHLSENIKAIRNEYINNMNFIQRFFRKWVKNDL